MPNMTAADLTNKTGIGGPGVDNDVIDNFNDLMDDAGGDTALQKKLNIWRFVAQNPNRCTDLPRFLLLLNEAQNAAGRNYIIKLNDGAVPPVLLTDATVLAGLANLREMTASELLGVAQHANSNEIALNAVANHANADAASLIAAATHVNTSERILIAAIDTKLAGVLRNDHTATRETLLAIAHHPRSNAAILKVIINHQNVDAEILNQVAKHPKVVAPHANEILRNIVNHPKADSTGLATVYANTNADVDIKALVHLRESKSSGVPVVAFSPLAIEIVNTYLQGSPTVQNEVASSSAETQASLALTRARQKGWFK